MGSSSATCRRKAERAATPRGRAGGADARRRRLPEGPDCSAVREGPRGAPRRRRYGDQPGVIRPTLLFSVKSKAWGEIVAQPVATGDGGRKGQLLTTIDPRRPQVNLT